MKTPKNNLLEDVKKCMTDPIYDIIQNFSLEKSKKGYEERVKQWESGSFRQNPAVKKEEVSFAFADLYEAANQCCQAHNMYNNLKEKDFNKGVDWYMCGQNIVVVWYRLKTFDEWLHDGLKDAIVLASKFPEDGVRMLLEKKIGKGKYSNSAIHLFAEGIIDEKILERLGTYESYQFMEGRDIEEDIKQAKKALEDMECCNKEKDVTVLTLKM